MDDLVVDFDDDGTKRVLRLQIKRSVTIGAGDENFCGIIAAAVKTQVLDTFIKESDKCGFIVEHVTDATLRTLKTHPGRVIAFFQPHGYGPLRQMGHELAETFARELGAEDLTILCDPVYFGGTVDKSEGSERIVRLIQQAGGRAEYIPSRNDCAARIIQLARPGDRVVVMPQNACGKCALCLAGEYIHCQNNYDFVAVHGSRAGSATMAQYLLKPDWLLVPVPEGVSIDHASLACCGLGPTFGAMQRLDVTAYDTVMITGLGPVGLGGVINGVFRGARVIGVDNNAWRAQHARKLGATAVVDPTASDALQQLLDLTDGRGVDHALDCSGVVAAQTAPAASDACTSVAASAAG